MATLRTGQTTDMSSQSYSDSTLKVADDFFSIEPKDTDSPKDKENSYTPDWKKYHGQYREIPELRAVIDKLASWTFGRGIIADEANKKKLSKIKGFGKDSPRSVLKNQWRTALICGDSFGEIIKDNQGRTTNLKPLNPGTIKTITSQSGIIKRYEQWINGTQIGEPFEPDAIYHLSHERIADEGHGIPFPEALEKLLEARGEALEDLRILYHRNIKPIQFFEVETSDQTKLNEVEATINKAYKKSENVVIPTGVIKEIKHSSTAQYSTLDSLPYVKFLVRQFITACGMPEVVMGWGAETTEAASKIIIVAYEQEIWDMKLYNEDQAKAQLGIEFEIEPAPSIMDELQKDNQKDKGQVKELNVNPKKDG